MKIDVSIGEIIDKYSILEIKLKNISDAYKLEEIKKEILILSEFKEYINKQLVLYNILIYINIEIWNMTNKIKSLNVQDLSYPIISNKIFEFNQKRFRIKKFLNIIFSSEIKEQKSYSESFCKIIVNNDETIYSKISEINFLSTEYDYIIFDEIYKDILSKIFVQPNILISSDLILNELEIKNIITLDEFIIDNKLKDIFDLIPFKYASSGRLGDFIQCLSIVNEKFYQTGKKGIIYIRNNETFKNGLEYTHKDTYEVIKAQKYINDYKIFNNENVDIDLDIWFHNKELLNNNNWYTIFSKTYNIEWGKHKWLNINYDEKWKDKVLVNVMHYRKPYNIDFKKLYHIFKDSLIFISFDKTEYEEFIKDTNIDIPNYIPSSFTDCCIAVNSCKLLVASLSGILTIGHACHKDRVIGLCGIYNDIHNINFNNIWDNVFYNV
jgi:hypothetical protein